LPRRRFGQPMSDAYLAKLDPELTEIGGLLAIA
jgi:hypothetical protein